MRHVTFRWLESSSPSASLTVDGQDVDLHGVKRVAIVLSEEMREPVVDVSMGTPLPLSLSDDGPAVSDISPSEFLKYVDADDLRTQVLQSLGGMEGDDPVTVTLNILRRWADGDE